MEEYLKWVAAAAVVLPLFGSTLWFWLRAKAGEKLVGYAATGTVFVSFLCVLTLFLKVNGSASFSYFPWIWLGERSLADFQFLIDPLSLTLGLVVTGVGSLIHLYAAGYMHGDEGFGRFFSYLNLFVFSMMMLIWSESMLGIFLGWEGVGLCSYLLISFWFSDINNAQAGKKAFIANRVGDFGFLLAMFCLYQAFGTLSIPELLNFSQLSEMSEAQVSLVKWACLGLVLGATGKSAQIPLFVWLPDAMAGPTPVSALIHAATMVTAGVYLACRLQGLFLINPEVLELIAYIGGATAFFAATIAIFQNDIKKVLAYSTISQLGYMFLAVGLAAPVAAYFHLITHAFFKALLFLGAGAVIHNLHHEQDMRKMGGLRKQMPITFWTMTIGVLAIAGIPPLSGFMSKDEVIHAVKESHRGILIFFAMATAFLTAFYMGRLWIMTFFGKFRGSKEGHESSWQMTSVLIALAVLAFFGGFINWPAIGVHWLHDYLGTVVLQNPFKEESGIGSVAFKVGLALLGLGLAWFKYRSYSGKDFESPAFRVFKGKYFVDEIYDFVFVRNLRRFGEFCFRVVDKGIIDGILNGSVSLAQRGSERFRALQTGLTQSYVMWVWLGVVILLLGVWTAK